MAPEQCFKDEWLVRLVRALPQFPAGFIRRARARRTPYLAQALVAAGLLRPEEIGRIVERTYRIQFLSPDRRDIDKAALRLVPERVCRSHMLLPIGADDRSIAVAMANPLDPAAQHDVGSASGRSVKPFYCPPDRIAELLARVLAPDQVILDLLERVDPRDRVEVDQERVEEREGEPEPVRDPVARLVDAILARAVQIRASDIHIEQDDRQTNVRYRVDGLLRKSMVLPRYVGAGPVVSRIKIIAKLDVSDRRRPQDGRATIRVGGAEIGLRVSTLPTALGEKVIIRILGAGAGGNATNEFASPHVRLDQPVHITEPGGPAATVTRPPVPAARVLVAAAGDTARTAAVALAAAGYSVEAAPDGPAALFGLAQRPPDVLVVDTELPVLDGIELIRRARTGMMLSALPILAVSGRENVERRAAAIAAGADDLITLAAAPSAIVARVRGMLERQGDYSPTSDIMRPPVPANEEARVAALRATGVLDTPPEERFDAVTRLAQRTFDVPIALVSLVDADRQWFKSRQGLDATETPRDVAFCAHAINGADVFVVPDAELDPRFAENPLLRGEPHMRFYAGYPLNGPRGEKLGTLCIADRKPRQMSPADIESLRTLGQLVERELLATTASAAHA